VTSSPRPPPFWLIVLVAWISAFSMHIVIPAMPLMAAEFGSDFAAAQRTLTAYLAGFAAGQLVYGPLSDRLGRRPVMLGGLALYLLASLGCALAPTIDSLVTVRLLQGAVGCAGQVLGRAILRDCHPRDRAASLIGYLTMAMAAGSAFSPLCSAIVQDFAGWRANFLILAAAGAIALVAGLRHLNETKLDLVEVGGPLRLAALNLVLLRSPAFLGYALSATFALGAWYSFVAGAPFVLTRLLGLPPIAYGQYVLIIMLGYVIGNFLAGRYSVRAGGMRMQIVGQAIALAAVGVQLALLAAGVLSPLALFVPMAVLVLASGVFLPNAHAGALSVHPELAGTAAGLSGAMQMAYGALCTFLVGEWMQDSEAPLILIIAANSILSALSLLLVTRVRA